MNNTCYNNDRKSIIMSQSVSINGEEKTLRELSEEYHIPYDTLRSRWYRGIRGESILQI